MKIDRLLGILTILLQKDRITAPELAARFEVNRRTIGRDIDALCQAGIPVVTYQGAGGGISIMEGFRFDKSILTADELSCMIAALKGLGSVSKKARIEQTLDKLHAGSQAIISLREPIVIDLASYHKEQLTEKIEKIKQAIRNRRYIDFDYFYDKGEMHRTIEPYVIIFKWGAWYVFGFCTKRNDFRMFMLTRLWNLELSNDEYLLRDIPPEKRDFTLPYADDVKLVALFDPSVKYRLIETYGLNCYAETKQGLRLEIGFSNPDFMLSWLLSFGGKVKVLEPLYIAQKIKEEAQRILSAAVHT